jgi:hypothetical protein
MYGNHSSVEALERRGGHKAEVGAEDITPPIFRSCSCLFHAIGFREKCLCLYVILDVLIRLVQDGLDASEHQE